MGNTTIRNTRVAAALLAALVAIAALFLVGPMAASAQDGGTITVSKVDEDGQPLKGAKLELQDKDGNVIESWTTDGSDKVISGLAYPHLYTLHEVSAPAGYEIAADQGVYLPAPAASAQLRQKRGQSAVSIL